MDPNETAVNDLFFDNENYYSVVCMYTKAIFFFNICCLWVAGYSYLESKFKRKKADESKQSEPTISEVTISDNSTLWKKTKQGLSPYCNTESTDLDSSKNVNCTKEEEVKKAQNNQSKTIFAKVWALVNMAFISDERKTEIASKLSKNMSKNY